MVGTPGSSKGCITCRKRKKGCDFQRPCCKRCLKGGFRCEGYDRDLAAIQCATINKSDTFAVATPTSPALSTATTFFSYSLVGEVALSISLSSEAYKTRISARLWEYYSVCGQALDRDSILQRFVKSWVPAAWDLYPRNPALKHALLALCLGSLARIENKNSWLWESQRLYVRSLHQMNDVLKSAKERVSDETLLTSKVLIAYELLYGLDDTKTVINPHWSRSWLSHQLGRMDILLQRQPEMHIDGHAHNLFVEGRLSMITASILGRKGYPLNNTRWKTIPWLRHAKSPEDFLIDILGEIPALFENTDAAILQKPCQRLASFEKVLEECWEINDQLKWWLENMGPDSLATRTLRAQQLKSSPATDDPTYIHIMCIYWAVHLLTHSTIRLILRFNQPAIQTNRARSSDQLDPELCCERIIKTASNVASPFADGFIRHPLYLPFGLAYIYLIAIEGSIKSPEMLQLVKLLNETDGGLRMRTFLDGMLRAAPLCEPNLEDAGWADQYDLSTFQLRAQAWFRLHLPVDLGSEATQRQESGL